MKTPLSWRTGKVDTTRPYFEAVHSLFKQTVARIGWSPDRTAIHLEHLVDDDKQSAQVKKDVEADLSDKVRRLSDQADSLEELFELLNRSCCHPSNMYTEVHWLPVDPAVPEPSGE